ncbi:MAG: serine/threonine protein kinase, partial [Lachnospiraceae bacterium]|nr:serine/threonine protein kinase [Lachnospiraceae bacterium]
MKQEQLHNMEPLWNHWYVEELLGEGSFGSVYRIKREDFKEVQYAALKVIGVPQTEQQVRQCFAEGLGEEEVWQYFENMVEEVYQEVTLMAQLKGKSNIVSYEDHEIRRRTEGIGYDIFIRMELLTSLEEYLSQKSMTGEEVIKMGKDLCQALCVCGRHNIIHRDIKPANIFISRDGDFKLGDFGIARRMQECPKDLSIKGSYTYMAPEVYLGSTYDKRVDIYSLGIVLYTYLNHKNIPFIQEHITYENKTQAIKRRLGGEKIPKLSGVPLLLADAIEKAVAYLPEERFLSPEEFLLALEKAEGSLEQSNISDTTLDKTMALASNPVEETEKEERICKENYIENNFDLYRKKQRSGWNKIYVHAITAMLFLLFGGAFLLAGVEGFGRL